MIKDILKRIFTKYTETYVGEDIWVYDGELEVGTKLSLENGEPVENGTYDVEGVCKVTVEDGVVVSIETAEETTEETTEENVETQEFNNNPEENSEETTEENVEENVEENIEENVEENIEYVTVDEYEALKSVVETLKAEIETLKETIKTIEETPVGTSAVEEFENIKNTEKNKSKAAQILSA